MNVESASVGIAAFFARWPDLGAVSGDGVPAPVTDFVRGLLAGRASGDAAGTGLLRPALIVDVVEITERGRRHVIASFDRFALRDPVRAAERRYNLTARERDVLTLLLSGMGAAAVAVLDICHWHRVPF